MGWSARDKTAWDKQRFKDHRSSQLNPLSEEAKMILAANPPKKSAKRSKPKTRAAKTTTVQKPKKFAPSPNDRKTFYSSWEWTKLRMQALERDGHRCPSCGATPKESRLVVDHIKPLGKFWHLRLSLNNLQVLCDPCNRGKGDWLHKDFRAEEGDIDDGDPLMAEFREIMRS